MVTFSFFERGGNTVKRYNQDHEYISSFGQEGQGPHEFISPFSIKLNRSRNTVYVASSKISLFSLDGNYKDSFKPATISGFGSIGAQYKTSGMAVLSGSQVILPSPPSK